MKPRSWISADVRRSQRSPRSSERRIVRALAPEQPAQEAITKRDGLVPLIDRGLSTRLDSTPGRRLAGERKRENRGESHKKGHAALP